MLMIESKSQDPNPSLPDSKAQALALNHPASHIQPHSIQKSAQRSVLTNVPFWWGTLTMEEATHVGVQKQYEKSLRLTLNFPMNLKLLYKSSLKKKKRRKITVSSKINRTCFS